MGYGQGESEAQMAHEKRRDFFSTKSAATCNDDNDAFVTGRPTSRAGWLAGLLAGGALKTFLLTDRFLERCSFRDARATCAICCGSLYSPREWALNKRVERGERGNIGERRVLKKTRWNEDVPYSLWHLASYGTPSTTKCNTNTFFLSCVRSSRQRCFDECYFSKLYGGMFLYSFFQNLI